jgi:dienelactone hydrolase
MLLDLNDGLFSELKQARPTIDLYRRDLQRGYVALLVSSLSSSGGPSEFRVALRSGLSDLANKLDQATKKVRDPQTRAHLRDLRAAIGG